MNVSQIISVKNNGEKLKDFNLKKKKKRSQKAVTLQFIYTLSHMSISPKLLTYQL